ncbi:hypothetical protein KV205_31030 [Streptomyces sp. SKN60]|uniref:hypothetical protein n=1 Tax=Streptomyces sp. SKN60 TaxID=2855506 RepID=UPI002245A20C|nr:hypothetical protein [Streptomyces sp. SKN60]MCX2184930.1 hypothetical protein [Streptomyces sp. SKN60]
MNRHERKEDEVRRLLSAGRPQVPGDLAARAVARGVRLLRRDRALRRIGWTLLALAAVAFLVWASVARPWEVPPTDVTPPLEGF